MKNFLSLILITAAIFSLVSCGGSKYEPVESSELESQTAFTISVDGKTYEVKYELYRFLFLSNKKDVDGGDNSVWSGANKDKYIAEIDEIIIEKAAEIYSVLHLANKVGIDLYSSEYDKMIAEAIADTVSSEEEGGFSGDYQKYLDYLKEINLNYSVADLLLRYSVAEDALYEYYTGTLDGEYVSEAQMGALKYTKEDVEAFYYNDAESVRVRRIYRQKDYVSRDRIYEIREALVEAAASSESAALDYLMNQRGPTTSASDMENGDLHGRHSEDKLYYEEMINTAFELEIGEVSDVIEVSSTDDEAYVIMYRIPKNNEHFLDCYDYIASIYVHNEIGKLLDSCSEALTASAEKGAMLVGLDRGTISMD